jgi:L-ribulose-5-phosphate 3-epimerase
MYFLRQMKRILCPSEYFILIVMVYIIISGCATRVKEMKGFGDGVLPGGNILSCETYSFRELFKTGEIDIMSFPAKMKELGIKGIAVESWYLKSLDEAYLDQVKYAAEAKDCLIVGLMTGADFCTADEKKRAEGVKAKKRQMRAAKYLGTGTLRIALANPPQGELEDVCIERVITALKELIPLAKELNVKIAVENHGGFTNRADNILKIIKGTDLEWVGACLDFKNWPRGKIIEESKKLAPYAYHTHAKAHQFNWDGEEVGVDYKTILGFLKEANYKGALSIEWEGKGDPFEGVKKTRDLILKYWR